MHECVRMSFGTEKMLQFIRGFIPQRFAYFKAVFHSVSAVLYVSCFKHIIIFAFAWTIILIDQIICTEKSHFTELHKFARQYDCWNNEVFSALKILDFLNIHLFHAFRVENYCYNFGWFFYASKQVEKETAKCFRYTKNGNVKHFHEKWEVFLSLECIQSANNHHSTNKWTMQISFHA